MKKCLIVVDYQTDFVVGSLAFFEALDLEHKIADKIAKYHKNNDDVIFTLDTHSENYINTQEGINLPIAHCIKGTEGHSLYGEVKKQQKSSDICIEKNTFGASGLFSFLQNKKYESIEIVGVVSNICVISNAVICKTVLPEVPIYVDISCIASPNQEQHNSALSVLKSIQVNLIGKED